MQKIGNITSTADANGEWTNGNVAAGTAPTILDAAWLNTVQRELDNVVTGGGLTLDPTNDAQVLAALKLLIKGGVTGVVGEARNAKMTVATASATATFTADELIVGTALGGLQYRLGSFSKTINLATVGAGGMDTGTAPASGYVALYAIYNPTTQGSALIAVNATASVAPQVYGGANMPTGYTASALVSVVPTNASSLISVLYQAGRSIRIPPTSIFTTTTATASSSPISVSSGAPRNALSISISANISTSSSSALFLNVYESTFNTGQHAGATTSTGLTCYLADIAMVTPQTIYANYGPAVAGFGCVMLLNSYTF